MMEAAVSTVEGKLEGEEFGRAVENRHLRRVEVRLMPEKLRKRNHRQH